MRRKSYSVKKRKKRIGTRTSNREGGRFADEVRDDSEIRKDECDFLYTKLSLMQMTMAYSILAVFLLVWLISDIVHGMSYGFIGVLVESMLFLIAFCLAIISVYENGKHRLYRFLKGEELSPIEMLMKRRGETKTIKDPLSVIKYHEDDDI